MYSNTSLIRLQFVYIINTVHLGGEIKVVHSYKKCMEWTALKYFSYILFFSKKFKLWKCYILMSSGTHNFGETPSVAIQSTVSPVSIFGQENTGFDSW